MSPATDVAAAPGGLGSAGALVAPLQDLHMDPTQGGAARSSAQSLNNATLGALNFPGGVGAGHSSKNSSSSLNPNEAAHVSEKLNSKPSSNSGSSGALSTKSSAPAKGNKLLNSIKKLAEFDPLGPRKSKDSQKLMPKYNSCSTLFVDSSLTNADLDQTLKCISWVLARDIKQNEEQGELGTHDIFSETLHPLSKHVQFNTKRPGDEDIFKFLECLFHAAELGVECAIITLVYIKRMIENTTVRVHTANWARVIMGGILLSSKVWDDHAVWNVDFCQIFPDIQVSDMNELERWFMSSISYNVSVRASLYAKEYFQLRDISESFLGLPAASSLKPLDMDIAKKLEERTLITQSLLKERSLNKDDVLLKRSLSAQLFKEGDKKGKAGKGKLSPM